jgi:hypothetical protein
LQLSKGYSQFFFSNDDDLGCIYYVLRHLKALHYALWFKSSRQIVALARVKSVSFWPCESNSDKQYLAAKQDNDE